MLCPVRALREYILAEPPLLPIIVVGSLLLFALPLGLCRKTRSLFLLHEVIVDSGSSCEEGTAIRAHSIRGIATSSVFFKNWSIASILDLASW